MTIDNFPMIHLSHAGQLKLTPSPTLHLNERIQALWAQGQTVYHMGFGESRFPAHPKLVAALQAHAHQTSYLAGQGLLPLREAAAGFYSRQFRHPVSAGQLIIGPGSKALMFAIQMALAADLIVPTPSWVSYVPHAGLLGRTAHAIPATAASGYQWDVAALDAVVRQVNNPAKLLVLNSPNNPTGQMFTADFLRQLADYCRQHHIWVLSDEIYGLVPHGRQPHHSMAEFYPEGTLVLGGLSKHLSLGGWRLGTAVLPATAEGRTLMHALVGLASEIWSSPSAPIQYAAVVAYQDDPEIAAYVGLCAHLHAARTQHVWSWLNELGVPCAQPAGGFYLFPNFDRWRAPLARLGVYTADDLATYLLEHYHIATLPGTVFGTPAHDLSLRLATSYLDMETAPQAADLLAAYRAHPQHDYLLEHHHPHLTAALEQWEAFLAKL